MVKIPTVFHVICKLHNICIDCWILQNPAVLYQIMCSSDEAPPFSADETLWRTFDNNTGFR
jgi:hypothetical protein